MSKRKLALPMVACLLTACGGGGGTSGGVGSTPPPPPPPTVTYSSFANLTANQQIALTGATFSGSGMGSTKMVQRTFADGSLKISYNSATGGYTVQSPIGTQTFLPANLDPSLTFNGPAFANYEKSGTDVRDFLSIYRPAGGGNDVPLTYTTLVSWTHVTSDPAAGTSQHEHMWGVGGFPTLASDMPRTGGAGYTGPLRGQASDGTTIRGVSGQARVIADFAKQTVQTDLFINGWTGSTIVVGGTGTISSNLFAGTLSGEGFAGAFDGGFFGPQASEMGLSFSVSNPNGTAISGVGAGRK